MASVRCSHTKRGVTAPSAPCLSSQASGSRRNNKACGCYGVSSCGELSGCGCVC